MSSNQQKVVLVGSSRTPFVRSFGKYAKLKNKDLLTATLVDLIKKLKLEGKLLDDVIGGSVIKSTLDFNLVRECVLSTELDPTTPGLDVQRACGTSLEAAIILANKIKLGQADAGIACGTDTNSGSPLEISEAYRQWLFKLRGAKSTMAKLQSLLSFKPKFIVPTFPTVNEPRTGLSMGDHCELMAKEWKIKREDQDAFALTSHRNAGAAYTEGFYSDLVFEFQGQKQDQFVRPDSTLEKMASLKPAFDKVNGTLTAANSTPLTDGAAAVMLASEDYAKKHNLPILAYIEDAQSAAVDFVGGEGLLMAPTKAVSILLQRNRMRLQDFDIYEIHEAFAAQVLCTLKAWTDPQYCKDKLGLEGVLGEIDRSKLNLKGSSLALGHPFAATGARMIGAVGKQLSSRANAKALLTACTAGGMGLHYCS